MEGSVSADQVCQDNNYDDQNWWCPSNQKRYICTYVYVCKQSKPFHILAFSSLVTSFLINALAT